MTHISLEFVNNVLSFMTPVIVGLVAVWVLWQVRYGK